MIRCFLSHQTRAILRPGQSQSTSRWRRWWRCACAAGGPASHRSAERRRLSDRPLSSIADTHPLARLACSHASAFTLRTRPSSWLGWHHGRWGSRVLRGAVTPRFLGRYSAMLPELRCSSRACDGAFLASAKHVDGALLHHVVSLWQCLFLYHRFPAPEPSSTATRTGIPTALNRGTVTNACDPHRNTRDCGRLVRVGGMHWEGCVPPQPAPAIFTSSHQLPFSPPILRLADCFSWHSVANRNTARVIRFSSLSKGIPTCHAWS
jgi:hypothetical protein